MLIGTFPIGADRLIPKLNIMTPCQSLLIVIRETAENFDLLQKIQTATVVSVSLQNSETGKRDEIIPYINLGYLSEISSYNEGVVLFTGTESHFPILLNPAGNISLSNNKFLEVELSNLPYLSAISPNFVDVYAITSSFMNDFVTRYEKLSIPQGTARQVFDVSAIEFVYFPNFNGNFDFIRLTHKNGVVEEINQVELLHKQCKENDITAVLLDNIISGLTCSDSSQNSMNAFGTGAVVNLLDVQKLEIVRESYASEGSYTVITGNMK